MTTLDQLHEWATSQPVLRVYTIIVRVVLATAFVPSGLVKILGQPFTSLPVTDPVGFFFAGFFSAHAFYRFVGIAQWTAGGLLLFPRTATLGAWLYLPIIVNIFVITLAIGPAFAGTRVVTGLLMLGDLYLLAWDWDRWKNVLPTIPTASRHGGVGTVLGLMLAAVIGMRGVTDVHMAWLRHRNTTGPIATVAVSGLLGLYMIVIVYRRAKA